MGKTIQVLGMDPSLRNWGLCIGTYDLESKTLQVKKLDVIRPVLPTGKQIRQNSQDLEAAKQLTLAAVQAAKQVQATFVEVPVGSQSARAMASYALCIGVLGAMRAGGIPFIEVTPTEVKAIAVGKATATKKEMIAWGLSKHPEANWPTYKRNGQVLVTEDLAEHMADATAAIHAGLATNQFQQALTLL